jgi:capsular exopolysaccharide synthesis family protein
MSELFSWLKRTEVQKKTSLFPVDTQGLQLPEPEEKVSQDTEAVAVSSPQPERGPARLEIVNPASFRLDAADWRVKTVLDPKTLVGEQYRFLRNKLVQFQRQHNTKKILVTSSVPGEGKTLTACCLAGILAQESKKQVLLVDADLRKPQASANLGVNGTKIPAGLSRLLEGSARLEDSFFQSSGQDFFFLPSGPVPGNPSELLSSPNLEDVITRLASTFDWVVIDSPPVLALADAMRMAPLCDTVLLVVLANKTSSKLIQQAIQMIGREMICGVVLNRVPTLRSSQYHYYQYYSNASTGRK